MEIRLNIYPRGFVGEKTGTSFEPQIWHRTPFLQKNLVRSFFEKYLVSELFVEVSPSEDMIDTFEFTYTNKTIKVIPVQVFSNA